MKKTFSTLGLLLFAGTASLFSRGILQQSAKSFREAQAPQVQRCAVMEHEQYLESINPNRAQQRMDYENTISSWIQNQQNNPSVQATITIPVVVHVVYYNSAQNISNNQIYSQIQVLNEDFGRTNPDASNTPSYWTSVAANTEIQYCLATVDPSGNATTGIERRQINSNVQFNTNDNVKNYNTNGLNAWDVTRYLNLWVCNLGGGLLGYGEFPTNTASNTFGLVMGYTCFGSNYTSYGSGFNLNSSYNRGRTSTHEIGHCFNLYHIWGDDGNSCSGSDYCADTPNQADENYGCPSGSIISCSNGPNGDMYQNYMDYSDDICMNLFTQNQKSRMLAVLNSAPYNTLQNSTACQTSTAGNDAGISAINSPATSMCGVTFTPNVTIRNYGTNNLTSATINYRIDAGPLQTYSWSGNLATNATQNVALSSMTTTVGTHTFTAYTSSPNNGTDANTGNDQSQRTFTVSSNGQNLPYAEGFESTTFPPTGCTINNPDGSTTWARTTVAAKTGNASMFMDNNNYAANGEVDELVLPAFNMTSVQSPVMTFQVAYRMYTNPTSSPNYSDTLRVMLSTDCGATWTQIYGKWSTNLTTATPSYSSTQFVPTQSQWRLETISLLPYQSYSNVLIKFRHTTDYENQMYVDDINITNTTDIAEGTLHNNINLFPNPTSGLVNVDVNMMNRDNLTISVKNAIGQTVSTVSENNTFGGLYTLDLTGEPNGVYFIEVQTGMEVITRRIVISH